MIPARYRALLALPGFVRLLVSSIAGRLPIGMSSLAILLETRAATHSFSAAGVAVGAFALFEAGAAPLTGVLIHRFGARVLIPSAVAQACFLVALVLVGDAHASAAVLVVMSAGVGGCMPPVSACTRMLWPRVTPDRAARESAYALDATTQEIIWTAGPLVVGVLAAAVSPSLAVLAVAAVTLTGTVLFAAAPAARLLVGEAIPGQAQAAVLRNEPLRLLLFAGILVGLGLGGVEVALPALAIHHGSHTASGLLLSVWSVGSMIGGIAYGAHAWGGNQVRRLAVLLLATAVMQLPLIGTWSLASAFPLTLLAGVCMAPAFSCLYSLIGEYAPSDAIAAAFTWNTAALVGGVAGGSALAGVIVSHLGLATAFAIASGFAVLAGLLVLGCERTLVEAHDGALVASSVSGA
jgi:MFS family permease